METLAVSRKQAIFDTFSSYFLALCLFFSIFRLNLTVFSLLSHYLYNVLLQIRCYIFADTIDKIDLKRQFTGSILNLNVVHVACIQLEIVCLFHVEPNELN